MMRRISVVTLAIALVAAALPTAALAEDNAKATSVPAVRVSAVPGSPHALSLQNATRGVTLTKSARQQTGSFLSTRAGKGTLAGAIIVAAVVIGYAASQGPDPTPATAK